VRYAANVTDVIRVAGCCYVIKQAIANEYIIRLIVWQWNMMQRRDGGVSGIVGKLYAINHECFHMMMR
jgi:hypothetical protein